MEIQGKEQDIDVYHYISLEKAEFMILEGKRISASKSTYTFTITEGLNEYINIMGNWLKDTEAESIHMKARIQLATYDQLNEMFSNFSIGKLKKFLIEKEEVTKEFAEAFTLSLKECECLGRCTIFSL
ncbi:hypothetical protein HWX41_07480 [Bacillus paramycoides]|uniref:hypothetical protein n=1 Tax=Bacillus paramycoides TaxID=2026194 RepID=UPI0015BE40CA|nr:hypothetical protein [Bacillus paramycoides]NWK68954.1 hypothetical protein [Bacillus paramycoides]